MSAFLDKSPEPLSNLVTSAQEGISRHEFLKTDSLKVIGDARSAVEALLEAAEHPPRNKRRFPARLKDGRKLFKPRVKPGGWIDTGRYRPGQVLSIADAPPHTMALSYDDEIDDDFRPHVMDWKTIRYRKKPPSLKEVFSPGTWIRHYRYGYGRLESVRDSTIDVAFPRITMTLIPDARLRHIDRVDAPEPVDDRPLATRLPPGTWIDRAGIGIGIIIDTENDSFTVFSNQGLSTWVDTPESPVIWKLDRHAFDLTAPREVRRIWWWRNMKPGRSLRLCPCCGYPNMGNYCNWDPEPVQCIVCGWIDEFTFEDTADEVIPTPDLNDQADWEWPNWGYSLIEARANFDQWGHMFRAEDVRGACFEETKTARRQLSGMIEAVRLDPSKRDDENWEEIERFSKTILMCLEEISADK